MLNYNNPIHIVPDVIYNMPVVQDTAMMDFMQRTGYTPRVFDGSFLEVAYNIGGMGPVDYNLYDYADGLVYDLKTVSEVTTDPDYLQFGNINISQISERYGIKDFDYVIKITDWLNTTDNVMYIPEKVFDIPVVYSQLNLDNYSSRNGSYPVCYDGSFPHIANRLYFERNCMDRYNLFDYADGLAYTVNLFGASSGLVFETAFGMKTGSIYIL